MNIPEIVSQDEWNAARAAFLVEEKKATRQRDRLGTRRHARTSDARTSGRAGPEHGGPRLATVIADERTATTDPLEWAEVSDRLARADSFWMSTVTPDGRPQARPVLGVWVDGRLHTTSNPSTRKARNLRADDRCAISVTTEGIDVVLEGAAVRVVDPNRLQLVADTYREKYGWPPVVADGAFDAPYGAPTAGPPPYHVFEIHPSLVFGLGTDEAHAPRLTRWEF